VSNVYVNIVKKIHIVVLNCNILYESQMELFDVDITLLVMIIVLFILISMLNVRVNFVVHSYGYVAIQKILHNFWMT
jgi:hypothetical protein